MVDCVNIKFIPKVYMEGKLNFLTDSEVEGFPVPIFEPPVVCCLIEFHENELVISCY